jgi:hypothetical protein
LTSPGPNGEAPILETRVVVNPVNRCRQTVVPTGEIEAFERDYVNLLRLSKQIGIHHVQLRKRLEASGIEPAFDPERVGARFYPREALRRAGLMT